MTKHRTLKAVGFFVVSAAILAFLALPNSQAGAGKPIRWTATIVPVDGGNLTGSGVFVGGQDHVNINNGLGTNDTPCSLTGDSGLYSFLELQVFTPSLQFNMGGFSSWGNPDPVSNLINLAPFGFPSTADGWPYCIGDFLNSSLHPTEDYPHIILRFTTCGCGNSTTDLMAMHDGDILPVHMLFQFFSHTWGCPPNSRFTQGTFLNLMMNAHGYYTDRVGDIDVKIQRTTVNGLPTWTAYVDTVFDNSAYQNLTFDSTSANFPGTISDYILGQYATCDSTKAPKGNKTTWTTTYHYPWAKAPLKFQIAFTKY